MAWELSDQVPLGTAVVRVLRGENPCKICEFVAAGKQEEKKSDQFKSVHKFDFFLQRTSLALYGPDVATDEAILTLPTSEPDPRPLRPPPRAV